MKTLRLIAGIVLCSIEAFCASFRATTLNVGVPSLPIGSMEEVLVNATNTVNELGFFIQVEDPNSYTGWTQYDQLGIAVNKKQPLGLDVESKLKTWLTSKVSRMVAKNPANPTATRFRAYARCEYGLSGTNSHLWVNQFDTHNEFSLVKNGTSYSVPPEAYSAQNLVYFPGTWDQVQLVVPNITRARVVTEDEIVDSGNYPNYQYGALCVEYNMFLNLPLRFVGANGTLTVNYTDGTEQVFDLSTGRQAGETILSIRLLSPSPDGSVIVSLKGGAGVQAVRLQGTQDFVTWETVIDITNYTGGAYFRVETDSPHAFFRAITFDDSLTLSRFQNATP